VLLQALGGGTSQGKGLPPEAKGEAPVVGVGEEACLPQAPKGRPVGGLPLGLHLAPEIFQEDPHGFAEPEVKAVPLLEGATPRRGAVARAASRASKGSSLRFKATSFSPSRALCSRSRSASRPGLLPEGVPQDLRVEAQDPGGRRPWGAGLGHVARGFPGLGVPAVGV
jgi:hypothetical protein